MTNHNDPAYLDGLARARDAAAELASEGVKPTRRAIGERARVRAEIAGQAAREWREHVAEESAAEIAVPARVASALERVWPLALEAARERLAEDVKGWRAQIQLAEQEVRETAEESVERDEQLNERIKEIRELHAERDELNARIVELEKEAAIATERITQLERRAQEAEARVAKAEARAERAEARADRAEERAEKARQ